MEEKKILVAGAGISGIDSAKLIARNGGSVILFDENKKGALTEESIRERLGEEYKDKNIFIVLGEYTEEMADDTYMMVISPGISLESDFAVKYVKSGRRIISEIELAWLYEKGTVAAITGTNGKTTTTTLVGEIIKACNPESYVVGNIGMPYTGVCDMTTEESDTIAEISSFQLETIETFKPHVSAVLNLTPDHLDRHHTFDNYIDAKLRINENQTEYDFCVLNHDDEEIVKRADRIKGNTVFFSVKEKMPGGCYMEDGKVILEDNTERYEVMDRDDFKPLGDHNTENLLAAVAISYYMGADVKTIARVCREFKGVPHRIEYVRTFNDVEYYNDSKGTNPDAAIKGIRAMKRPTVLIGGGYDKQIPFDDWIKSFDGKVKKLLLIGQTAEIIRDCAAKYGFTDVELIDDFETALKRAREIAEPGDAVLLSPACASWGMFKNYEQRGDMFRDIVNSFE